VAAEVGRGNSVAVIDPEAPLPGPTSTIATPVEHLDLATAIKVSQAVSGETVLEKLIRSIGTGRSDNLKPSSHPTLRWRDMDSNHRSRDKRNGRQVDIGENLVRRLCCTGKIDVQEAVPTTEMRRDRSRSPR
jgi:hypothetical protein